VVAAEASLALFGLLSLEGSVAPVRHIAPGTRHTALTLDFKSSASGAELAGEGHVFHLHSAVLAAVFLGLVLALTPVMRSHLRRTWQYDSDLVRTWAGAMAIPCLLAVGAIWVFGTLG